MMRACVVAPVDADQAESRAKQHQLIRITRVIGAALTVGTTIQGERDMRDILSYADNFKGSTGTEYAARLASLLDARLTGVYVCPSPMGTMPACDAPQLLAAVIEEIRELESLAYQSAPAFEQRARELGVKKAAWQVAEGHVPDVLAHLGNWHDLLVVGRDAQQPWATPPLLGSIVLGSHLPCLIVPPGMTQPRLDTIVVAWNGSPEAIRAIHAAGPLLGRANRIVVLRGQPREQFSEIGWKPEFDLARYFEREDLRVQMLDFETTNEEAGASLIAVAESQRADLLVMGAYGRTRFSEWIFGGATRHVLTEASMPVFMRH
jgi:nucleotide-binding universal stress UspA family protein